MTDPIMQALDEMQARCDAAPDGKWFATREGNLLAIGSWDGTTSRGLLSADLSNPSPEQTAWFIASARTDMPRLISALRAVIDTHTSRWGECAWCVNGSGQNCKYPCPTVKAVEEALGVES